MSDHILPLCPYAEVVAVTSKSKPFCVQPSSYTGEMGDCWITNAAETIDDASAASAASGTSAASGGRCFGEWRGRTPVRSSAQPEPFLTN